MAKKPSTPAEPAQIDFEQVLREVIDQINDGLLDKKGVHVTAEVIKKQNKKTRESQHQGIAFGDL